MGPVNEKPVEPASPADVAQALNAVLSADGVTRLLVPLRSMQTLAAMPQQFGLQRSPEGCILLAGLPLEVCRHIPEKSSILALGVS